MESSTYSKKTQSPVEFAQTIVQDGAPELAKRKEKDIANLRRRFKKTGRIHIPDILTKESVQSVYQTIDEDTHWNLVTNNQGRHLDLDASGMAKLSDQDQIRFSEAVHSQARWEFQYLFANFPIYDAYHSGRLQQKKLKQLFEFLNSPAFLRFVREVTGDLSISFADAQATKYEPGHFLTVHDDNIAGKNRSCAYVLNLTKEWRADWGGLLQFHGPTGHVIEAFTPAFNALNIFKVPQEHSVSTVAPFAGSPRYSITGWLRSGIDPNQTSKSIKT